MLNVYLYKYLIFKNVSMPSSMCCISINVYNVIFSRIIQISEFAFYLYPTHFLFQQCFSVFFFFFAMVFPFMLAHFGKKA
jgi:hypothetical protein